MRRHFQDAVDNDDGAISGDFSAIHVHWDESRGVRAMCSPPIRIIHVPFRARERPWEERGHGSCAADEEYF